MGLELIASMYWDDAAYYGTEAKRGEYFMDSEGEFWKVKSEVCYPHHPGLDMKKYNDESLFDKAPLMPDSFLRAFKESIEKDLYKGDKKE